MKSHFSSKLKAAVFTSCWVALLGCFRKDWPGASPGCDFKCREFGHLSHADGNILCKRQHPRVTVPGGGAGLEDLRWCQVGSVPTARCVMGGTIMPVFRAQLWQGEVPLCAEREGRRGQLLGGSVGCPQRGSWEAGKEEEGASKAASEVTVTEWTFPYCFICSLVLPWALMFSNLDQRDLKSCRKG